MMDRGSSHPGASYGRANASFFVLLSVFEKPEQILRHAPHLDFLRSLCDAIAPVMPENVLEWLMPRVPDRAMHLHRAVRRFAHRPTPAGSPGICTSQPCRKV